MKYLEKIKNVTKPLEKIKNVEWRNVSNKMSKLALLIISFYTESNFCLSIFNFIIMQQKKLQKTWLGDHGY